MSWRPVGDGRELNPAGYDGTVWLWELVSEDGSERRGVRVKVTGTALITNDLHWRVANARESKGQREVARVLEWDEPPDEIEFHSRSTAPTYVGGVPSPEFSEIAEIVAWFEDRHIVVLFTGRGGGTGPQPPPITTHAANLLDLEKDKLVHRVEAPSRLEAVRGAKAWWQEHRERRGQVLPLHPATATSEARLTLSTTAVPRPEITPEEAARLRRLHVHLVWTGPDPDDADSDWMIEVVNELGELIGLSVQPQARDALLTVFEDIIPPGEPA